MYDLTTFFEDDHHAVQVKLLWLKKYPPIHEKNPINYLCLHGADRWKFVKLLIDEGIEIKNVDLPALLTFLYKPPTIPEGRKAHVSV